MNLATWRDASIILLSCEAFLFILIPGAIFFFVFKGLRKLELKAREVSPKVQRTFRQANRLTHRYADKLAAPVIKGEATAAQVAAMGRRTTSIFTRREA